MSSSSSSSSAHGGRRIPKTDDGCTRNCRNACYKRMLAAKLAKAKETLCQDGSRLARRFVKQIKQGVRAEVTLKFAEGCECQQQLLRDQRQRQVQQGGGVDLRSHMSSSSSSASVLGKRGADPSGGEEDEQPAAKHARVDVASGGASSSSAACVQGVDGVQLLALQMKEEEEEEGEIPMDQQEPEHGEIVVPIIDLTGDSDDEDSDTDGDDSDTDKDDNGTDGESSSVGMRPAPLVSPADAFAQRLALGKSASHGQRHHRALVRERAVIGRRGLRRLGRRAGVYRFSNKIYADANSAVREFLTNVLQATITYTEHARRKTISAQDVKRGLELAYGMKLYD